MQVHWHATGYNWEVLSGFLGRCFWCHSSVVLILLKMQSYNYELRYVVLQDREKLESGDSMLKRTLEALEEEGIDTSADAKCVAPHTR